MRFISCIVLVSLLFCCNPFINCNSFIKGVSKHKDYSVTNGHAHNDYAHPTPFVTAYNAGFGSIEADVYPVNGVLQVAHDSEDIRPGRTLKALYLGPLLEALQKDSSRKLKLLIDIKQNYRLSLQILLEEIGQLEPYLVTGDRPDKPVTILISGERPPPAEYKNYPGFIFFDDDLKLKHTANEWKRVGQVSLSFENYSSWKGEGALEEKDQKLLKRLIKKVHKRGKTIRFWAAPDNALSWKTQTDLGVDLIGTDKIEELTDFLEDIQKYR